ncbi:MAG: Xaa-Pro peptidase family protein [Cyclobacteriaceae bacterium]
MKESIPHCMFKVIIFFLFFTFSATAHSQLLFEREEFAGRRDKLMEKIGNAILVIRGASMPTGYTQFYQYNDLMYLTGVELPGITLLMDGKTGEAYLFISVTEEEAKAEGFNLQLVKDPKGVTGIENIYSREELTAVLTRKISERGIVYAPFSPNELMTEVSKEKRNIILETITNEEWDGRVSEEMQFVNNLKKKFPNAVIRDCSPLIWDLRKIKSEAEIAVMREAGRVGVEAHKAVMKATGVNVTEKYLANLFEYTCQKDGASGLGYYSILMSGTNHAYGHYHTYNRTLENGDFVILDAGPDYQYYDVDISTTFPANGKFSHKQEEGYALALLVHETCLKSYRPGITLADVGRKIKEALARNGYDPDDSRFSSWYKYGGYNHSIGMAVHDGMGTFAGADEILKTGFVFACDIITKVDSVTSVRIEDTVLITEDGCEVLSKGLPRTIDEIESFMDR